MYPATAKAEIEQKASNYAAIFAIFGFLCNDLPPRSPSLRFDAETEITLARQGDPDFDLHLLTS